MEFFRVPAGEGADQGVICCHGDDVKIWVSPTKFDTEYEWLTEGEAQIAGLWQWPGTPTTSKVDEIRSTVQDRYGTDIKNVEREVDGDTVDLYYYLDEMTASIPESDADHTPPWDVDEWK
jgi:hypothetical protein